jgi:hypothetical protein
VATRAIHGRTPPDGMDSTLTVFLQTGAGVFDPVPSLTLRNAATTNGPSAVAVADLDGNGSADLVSASNFSDTLAVFFQTGPGVFDTTPSLTLRDPGGMTDGAVDLAAADLDGDGARCAPFSPYTTSAPEQPKSRA